MKLYTLKKLLLIITLLSSQVLMAQNENAITVSGSVKDNLQKPLDYVTMSLLLAKDSSLIKTAVTDANGKYSFNSVANGNYLISTRFFGFKDAYSKPLEIKNQNIEIPAFTLALESRSLNEVTVTAKKPLIERKVDRLVLNVENSTLAVGSTALEVLQRAPGVTVDQNDNIAMQGKQGVNVMLDGKMTYMSNADVVNMLKNMQSNEIETIELITNPSSKYDASGNAGIINIKRKKGKGLGTNGSINAGIGQGINTRGNAGISINNRSKNANVFGSYNYSHSGNDQVLNIDRITGTGNNVDFFSQAADNHTKNNNNNFKGGVDFFLNKNNTLGFMVNGYIANRAENNTNNTLIGKSFNSSDSSVFVNSTGDKNYKNFSYNANYKVTLDSLGQEFTADADYSNYKGNELSNYDNYFFRPDGSTLNNPLFIRNGTPSKINISALKADYVKPLTKTVKLEAGAKSSWVTTDNDFQFAQLQGAQWKNDASKSNHFIYTENVNATYFNISKEFKKTSIQFGLRAEQTNSKGDLVTTNNVVKRSYVNFFPTAFISQPLGKNHDLSLSYSRRIDRPSYDDLNPFIYYLDQYTYSKGNPFLKPQFTNNFEVGYTLKKMYSLTLSYSLTKDVITQVLLPDDANKSLYQTNANLDKQINYGANMNVPITIAKWWNSSNNFGGFYMGFRSADLQGKTLNTGKTVFQLNSQHNFTITKTLGAELSADYTSPMEYGTLKIQSQYGLNAGLSKSLMNKKLSIKLAMTDILNTRTQTLASAYPGLSYNLTQKNETQIAKLSLSYKFGKNDIKPSRRRATGLESEQSRLKN
ncbi:MAG: outer membrane beta-barrel family protein [Pelobium sp.]